MRQCLGNGLLSYVMHFFTCLKNSKDGSWPWVCILIRTVVFRELIYFQILIELYSSNSVQISPLDTIQMTTGNHSWLQSSSGAWGWLQVQFAQRGFRTCPGKPNRSSISSITVLLKFIILFNVLRMTISHANQFLSILLLKFLKNCHTSCASNETFFCCAVCSWHHFIYILALKWHV